MKNFSLWLDCWGEISQVLWKAKHENILWDCSSLWEGECALQSQSCREYFMSLANVVCKIWTINQTLAGGSGKQSVKWRRACRVPSKWHLGEKKRGKKQWKECLWYWNDFTYIYSKRLEIYIDLSRSWCWGELNQHSLLPCQVWFMLGIWQPLSSETFQSLLFYFLSKANELFEKQQNKKNSPPQNNNKKPLILN